MPSQDYAGRMNARIPFTLCAAALIAASPGMTQEQAAFEQLPGFELAFQTEDDGEFIREYLQPGDTVDDWREMQTHQRFPSWAGGNPIQFLRLLAGQLQEACPEVGFRVTNATVAGGYPNAAIYGRCLNPQAEWFVIVAISGDEALHVVQHSWRIEPAQAAFAARLEALTSVPLCRAARSPVECP
ncbi:MAG: hypothetical protein AAGA70_08275 [Pseudomonadota bacterium]